MEAVLVSGQVGRFLQVGRALALAGLVIGLLIVPLEGAIGIPIAVLAGVLFATLQAGIMVKKLRQCWITDTGSGFDIRDRQGQRSYEDEDVYGVDLEVIQVFSQGVPKGVRRIFRLKVEGDPVPIRMVNMIRVGEQDPLNLLIDRVVRQYLDNAFEALQSGAVVEGKNWALSSSTLTVTSKSSQVVSMAELDSVAVFDSMVCVWKKGGDEAILKTPIRSPNAFLLQLLLERIFTERAETDSAAAQQGLGRILFERKAKRYWVWLTAGLACFFALGFLIAAIRAVVGAMEGGVIATALAFLVAAVLCSLAAVGIPRYVFRCHERGVYKRSLLSERQLRYEDVHEFTYSATRQYYNGIYIGTSILLDLRPVPGAIAKPIRFNSTVKNTDDSLDNLRDHIARVVAVRMLDQLSQDSRVQWTPNLAFLADGIEYRPGALLGRKPAKTLPFPELRGFEIQEGTFHLWDQTSPKSIMQESIAAVNFFPGYYVLVGLCSETSPVAGDRGEFGN